MLEYAFVGNIPKSAAATSPRLFGTSLIFPCARVLENLIGKHGIMQHSFTFATFSFFFYIIGDSWSSMLKCQSFAYGVVSTLLGDDGHWPDKFIAPGGYIPWILDLN